MFHYKLKKKTKTRNRNHVWLHNLQPDLGPTIQIHVKPQTQIDSMNFRPGEVIDDMMLTQPLIKPTKCFKSLQNHITFQIFSRIPYLK